LALAAGAQHHHLGLVRQQLGDVGRLDADPARPDLGPR